MTSAIRRRLHNAALEEKEVARRLHAPAVTERRRRARAFLEEWEEELLEHFADGSEVEPSEIKPRLVLVETEEQQRLFRYAALHWSIPVSSGYGRRIRFLVMDSSNKKLIGLIGLGDPVYGLRDRDNWIGWDAQHRRERLRCVMDAFVLGAVPPYSALLGGKLVAALATSKVVQDQFWRQYANRRALISRTAQRDRLVLITTASAYGRSSVYNRVRLNRRDLWTHVGYTSGHGEFLFGGRLYERLVAYVDKYGVPTARHVRWKSKRDAGTRAAKVPVPKTKLQWRNRREVVRTALTLLGLPYSLHVHGLRRGIYAAPLGEAAIEWLRGSARTPRLRPLSVKQIGQAAVERWMVPRSLRDGNWKLWQAENMRLWSVSRDRQQNIR